jgi:hypothetical protein
MKRQVRTYFEHLEAMLDKVADTGFVEVPLIRREMIKDWHMLYHDAEFEDGCPVCDEERKNQLSSVSCLYRRIG